MGIKYNLMKEKSTVSPEFERRNQRKAHICMRWWRAPKPNENQTNN